MSHDTSPSTIEHTLTLDILRGRYAVGSRLPSVRELAESFGVNPATIQRVVARLETRGLITARQGSGLRVNDPAQTGDLSLTPLWLEATRAQPERAAAILGDLLELRRAVAVRLMVTHRDRILAELESLRALAERVLAGSLKSVADNRDADLAFARALLDAAGNRVAIAVFNTLAQVVVEIPAVAQAMYGWTDDGAEAHFLILDLLSANPEGLEPLLDEAMRIEDAETVERFLGILQLECEQP